MSPARARLRAAVAPGRPRAGAALLLACSLLLGAPARASSWPSAARRVERALADPDVEVRRRGAKELGELTRSAAQRLAAVALGDPDVEVRLLAVEVATRLSLSDLGARLSAWLSDPEARI